MYENETYDVIIQRMLDRVPNNLDKRESSLIWDTHSATALELQNVYIGMDAMIANAYGDTAAREYLILLCKDRGIIPEVATNAILKGEFTPVSVDVTGQRFNIGELNYIVTEQIEPGQYQVMCETPGIIGNQYMGQMIPIEYIEGLETAELTEILIPGEDEEETEALRERYFDSFNEQAFGGNRADYLDKVRKIDGVGDLKVTRVWNSDIRPADMIPTGAVTEWYSSVIDSLNEEVKKWLSDVYIASYEHKLTVGGTVLLTLVNSLDYGEASSTLIDSVQTTIDPVQNAGEGYGLAPIGHVVTVKSAESVVVNVSTNIVFNEGYTWDNMKEEIETAVDGYLVDLRKEWADNSYLVVRIAQLEMRILSLKGVVDISGTTINGTIDNLILSQYQIPVLGKVVSAE